MKIPESVRIGGVEYPVVLKDNVRDGNTLCYGRISFTEDVIELSKSEGCGHQRQCVTLLHEIIHGVLYQAGSCLDLEDEVEEKVVTVLAKGLYQVLEDNGGRLFDLRVGDEELAKELWQRLEDIRCAVEKVMDDGDMAKVEELLATAADKTNGEEG